MSITMKDIITGQRGQAFAITLIVVAVTGLLSIPVLSLTSSVLHRSTASRTTLDEQYSVDGGTEDAIWRLQNDPSFLNDILQTVPAPTYAINVNGQPVEIEAKPFSPPSGPPTPVPPTPTPNPGIAPLMWTTADPPEIEYLNPPATVRVTINIQDPPSATTPTIEQMVEILPANFTYVAGSLECDGDPVQCTNLVWNNASADPVEVADLEAAMTIENPMFPTTRIPNPNPPSPGVLPDPWDPAAQTNSCPPDTSRADDNNPHFTQRLDWQWSNPRPQVVDGTTATISFDAAVPNPIDPATLPLGDNPWIETNQNQCNQGGSEQLQAGKPFGLRVTFTVLITTTQGKTALKSLVRFVLPSPVVEIKSQGYGQ